MEQPHQAVLTGADDLMQQQQHAGVSRSSKEKTRKQRGAHNSTLGRRSCRPSRSPSLQLFSFLVLLHTFHPTLAAAQAAASLQQQQSGPPCVACDDCVTSSCLRICVPSCRTAASIAEGSDLSTEQCKHKGQEAALDIATAACKLSQAACQKSSRPPAQFASLATVSGSQCAALANAGCQKMASHSAYSPCGANQFFGHRVCSGRQFGHIYKVKVNELCLDAMHKLG